MADSPSTSAPSLSAPARPVAAARTRLLLEGAILPTLLRLSAPNILNLLAITGLITFDGLFLGRLGPDALAGVSLVFPWVMLMQHAAASGMGGAVASAVARALGAGKQERANALATHAFALAVVLAAIFSATMLAAGPFLYAAMGGRGAILDAALAYSNVAFGGIISVWMLNILASVVRGTGNMSLPAIAIVASVLGHVLVSPALIFGWGPFPKLGPAGAGWGLVLSFGAGSLFLAARLRASASLVTLSFRDFRFQRELLAEFFRVGIPGFLNVAITNLTVVVLTSVAVRMGRDAALGYAIGARLDYIMIPLAFGFGTAIVAMVGTNWGAKQFDRAVRIAWIGAGTAAVACGAVGLFFTFFPQLWTSLFSDDPAVKRTGAMYLQIVGPAYAAYGMGMALYFATQGLGRVVLTVMANGARLIVSAAGAAIAVSWLELGMPGFFLAIAGAYLLYAVLTALALRRLTSP